MRYFYIVLSIMLIGCSDGPEYIPTDQFPYTNKKFLKKHAAVRQHLFSYNQFCPVTFMTEDNIMLSGLFRKSPKAEATIITFAGFYPGRKEGLALFAQLFDATMYNILLVDARGHGQSEGSWLNLSRFGKDEYKDVVAAIEFVHQETNKPIILYGLCAGGYHAAKGLLHLKPSYLKQLQVQGLIIDSGWASVCEIAGRAVHQDIKWRIPTKFLQWIVSAFFNIIYYLFYELSFEQTDRQFNLREMISYLKIPILYIHAQTDEHAPIQWCHELAQNTKHKRCLILPKGRHAHLHLQHTDQLKQTMHEFITGLLN
jgi:uncharacterized protein